MIRLQTLLSVWPFIFCFIGCGSPTETAETGAPGENIYKSIVKIDSSEGQKIFTTNCRSCHLFNKDLTGPPLTNLAAKWKSKKDLYAYMRNPTEYINTKKDQRVIQLHKQYGIAMPAFSFLKNAELDSIFQYIDAHREIESE